MSHFSFIPAVLRHSFTATVLFVFSHNIRAQTHSHDPITLDDFTVLGRADDLIKVATTASQGRVAAAELSTRPLLRRGEMLEVVPGLVVTQHSGGGKANQYFLRGYNLDHGTDFALFADGVPINLRTHGHGQGYADLNFIMPELVEEISYNKGPFFPSVGDFSAAGAAELSFKSHLHHDFVSLSWGEFDTYRGAVGASAPVTDGHLTFAAEATRSDGPFELPEDFLRKNAFFRFHQETPERTLTVTALGYESDWTTSDQIPARAIAEGSVGRFGNIDPTNGGESRRLGMTMAGEWRKPDGVMRLNLYATTYDLNLYSNFTYFLEDPVNGDQFEQVDDRTILGGTWDYTFHTHAGGRTQHHTFGVQTQVDLIDEVGLHLTTARQRRATVRSDAVNQGSLGVFWETETHWSDQFRTTGGLRADAYAFDVTSDLSANSGSNEDWIVSPKFAAIYTLNARTELYAGAGFGFHSNDARGTTVTIDPVSGTPADPVDPLARSRGVEIGWRSSTQFGWISTLSLFHLENDSELVFVGDAGGTEASGASQRRGLEWANFYQPLPWLSVEADLALTHARFQDAPGENHIPGSIDRVFSGGVRMGKPTGWYGEMRVRHFGPRALTEDGTITGKSSTLWNARLGWRSEHWEFTGDILNVFDRQDRDIEYYYTSRLPGEPAGGIDDVHVHPVVPLSFRLTATWRY